MDDEQNVRSSNTGHSSPFKSGVSVDVDWLEVSLKNLKKFHDAKDVILDYLGIDFEKYEHEEGRFGGYRQKYTYKGISFLYDCPNEFAGLKLMLTGEGCETFREESKISLETLLLHTLSNCGEVNISRLDIAVDEYIGLLKLNRIENLTTSGAVKSKVRQYGVIYNGNAESGEDYGKTVSFGKRGREKFIRFYDKGKQLGVEEHWTRCEVESRGKLAQQIAEDIAIENIEKGRVIQRILSKTLDFKVITVGADRNHKERMKSQPFWTKFINEL